MRIIRVPACYAREVERDLNSLDRAIKTHMSGNDGVLIDTVPAEGWLYIRVDVVDGATDLPVFPQGQPEPLERAS